MSLSELPIAAIIAAISSMVGGLIVAILNNLWQRNREEFRLTRDKGEKTLSTMNFIKHQNISFFHQISAMLELSEDEVIFSNLSEFSNSYNVISKK